MTYDVWYKKSLDGHAPSVVDLTDYSKVGSLTANSPREIVNLLRNNVDGQVLPLASRQPLAGDVVTTGQDAFILTPTGHWAAVQCIFPTAKSES